MLGQGGKDGGAQGGVLSYSGGVLAEDSGSGGFGRGLLLVRKQIILIGQIVTFQQIFE